MSEQSTSKKKTKEPTAIAPGPKEKDPAKVAAGEKLGAMSRQAKANKALRLKQEAEAAAAAAAAENSGGYHKYVVGGLIVVGAVSYLLFKNKEKVTRTFSADKEEPDPVPEREQTTSKKKFKSVFDD